MINGLLVDTHCIAIIYSAPPLTALTQRAMNACNVIFASTSPPSPQERASLSANLMNESRPFKIYGWLLNSQGYSQELPLRTC